MTPEQREKLQMFIADGFDTYLADGRMPPDVEGDDLLGQYARDVIGRNLHLGGADPDYRDVFRQNLEAFVSSMSDKFEAIDRSGEPERLMLNNFIKGTSGERRAMWNKVKDLAFRKYSPGELDAEGYDSQLTDENEKVVFDMFARDWNDALEKRDSGTKRHQLASAAAEWEKTCARRCRQDYETRRQLRNVSFHFPQLAEIARIIGRRNDSHSNDTVSLSSRYAPSVLSRSVNSQEIDRITTGNDLECIIPAEYSYLACRETEMLFMVRYARRQLLQFTSPGCDSASRTLKAESVPRPVSGPIIVSVDTSSSMDGRASEIAAAMLYQLLEVARRENRRCFLITFSVRARSIDLSEAGQWRKIDEFLSTSYTGGTNGEQMLREAIRQLHTDDFSMADVLMISDFAFAPPQPDTLAAIRREQALDTRFYGLRIGHLNTPYDNILDKIWQVE
ncbi:MAG: hypothetical protein K2L14_05040 [Duncaniella sp.]|nr:hypothetical protein [Duncaniella sp.]